MLPYFENHRCGQVRIGAGAVTFRTSRTSPPLGGWVQARSARDSAPVPRGLQVRGDLAMNVEPQDATRRSLRRPAVDGTGDLVNSDQSAVAACSAFARECFDEYQNEIGSQQPLPRQPTHLVEEFFPSGPRRRARAC